MSFLAGQTMETLSGCGQDLSLDVLHQRDVPLSCLSSVVFIFLPHPSKMSGLQFSVSPVKSVGLDLAAQLPGSGSPVARIRSTKTGQLLQVKP